jgi:hypothetical protein
MTRVPRIHRCFLVAAAVILAAGPARAASIVLNYKDGDKTGWYRQVSTRDSVVALNPADPMLVRYTGITGDLKTALVDSNFAKHSKWNDRLNFQISNTDLTGTFDIDVYYAQHSTATLGGAQFLVRYLKGAGETDAFVKSLQWLQIVKTTDPNGNEPSTYPDVYNSGYPAGKELPFYYNLDKQTKLDPNTYVGEANIYQSSYNLTFNGAAKPTNLKYDLSFFDWPQREPDNSWRAGLFLGSYAPPGKPGDKGTVTIYGQAVFWGFTVQANPAAVPEPSSLVLALASAPGLIALAIYRRRRSR